MCRKLINFPLTCIVTVGRDYVHVSGYNSRVRNDTFESRMPGFSRTFEMWVTVTRPLSTSYPARG